MCVCVYLRRFVIVLCYNACTIELGRLNLDIYATYSVAMAFELPGDLFSILLLDKVGRRWPNVTFMFLGGVVSLLMAMLRTGACGPSSLPVPFPRTPWECMPGI